MWQNKITTKDKESSLCHGSVDFDRGIDFPDEHVGSVEANRARQQPEWQDHQGCIAEVQEGGDELHNVQLERNEQRKNDFELAFHVWFWTTLVLGCFLVI